MTATSMPFETREAYLQALAFALEQYIEECAIDPDNEPPPLRQPHGYESGARNVPTYQVSVGLPSKRPLGLDSWVRGETFPPEASKGEVYQIFVSPRLSDPLTVACTLLHELLHAYVGCQHKHGGAFKKAHKRVGFWGKPTLSIPGEDLRDRLHAIVQSLGPYPHQELVPRPKEKKDGTRQRKVECSACGYVLRTTKKWLEQAGPPICPCSGEGPRMEIEAVEP